QGAHHRPPGLSAVAGVELALELVERREPVALPLVAQDVHEPGEAVDGAQMRAQLAWEEEGGDGEVLCARACGDLGDVHGLHLVCRGRRRQSVTVLLGQYAVES